MSENRIKGRWMDWNLFGKGIDRSPFEGSKYAYRGTVLFAHDWPVSRMVPAPKKNFVVLCRPGGYIDKTEFLKSPNIIDCIQVEDLGVFSKFEGDMLDVEALHERSKWLFNAEASDIIERATTIPESTLVATDIYRAGNRAKLVKSMETVVQLYDRYRFAFGLKWLAFPPNYKSRLTSVIEARAVRYNSPEEEAKRERRYAREEAKKALGLVKNDD